MALSFTGGTTDKVTVTNPQTLGAGSEFTFWMWIYKTDDTAGRGSKKGGDLLINGFSSTDDCFFNVNRATTNSDFISNADQFPSNVWSFMVCTYSESDGCRGFRGSLTSAVTELSYSSRTAGSGNTSADTGDLYINNRGAAATSAMGGQIACAGWISRRLDIGEIQSLQFNPRKVVNTEFYGQFGFNGTTDVSDWSGNNRAGAITGATVANHIPLRPLFGGKAGWLGSFKAAAAVITRAYGYIFG